MILFPATPTRPCAVPDGLQSSFAASAFLFRNRYRQAAWSRLCQAPHAWKYPTLLTVRGGFLCGLAGDCTQARSGRDEQSDEAVRARSVHFSLLMSMVKMTPWTMDETRSETPCSNKPRSSGQVSGKLAAQAEPPRAAGTPRRGSRRGDRADREAGRGPGPAGRGLCRPASVGRGGIVVSETLEVTKHDGLPVLLG